MRIHITFESLLFLISFLLDLVLIVMKLKIMKNIILISLFKDKITEEELPLFSFEETSKEMDYICENITLEGN